MSDTDSLYLQKLKFDPKLKKGLMWVLIHKVRIVMLIILSLIFAGVGSFIALPRELNPEVDIPIVNIVTTLPGASPTDVEQLVTTEIERAVADVSGIDTLTSSSTNSVSVVTIQFLSSEDPDDTLQRVKDRVDVIVTDLPEDASEPTVAKLDFNEQPVLTVALTGPVNQISLAQIASRIETNLEDTSGISRVDISGEEEEEIVVQVKPETLVSYQISPQAIANTIQSNNLKLPAGTIVIGNTEYSLTVGSEYTDIENVRNQIISLGNQTVTLGEIADIYYRSKPSDVLVYSVQTDGSRLPAVQLSIFKTDTATISDAANTAIRVLENELVAYPEVDYQTVLNVATDIEKQFNDLTSNFISTIALVFLILFAFLGIRQATVASISIPLTFLSAFIIMSILGISLNFLSLFSLLLALGLVVDDAIVIVQAANNYGKKFKPDEAALLVFRDFVVPIWSTTLTTVWAFLPLLLASGIIGAFIRSIPIVVSAALISSTTIAVFLNIPLTVIFAQLNDIPKRVRVSLALLSLVALIGLVYSLVQGSPWAPATIIAFIALLAVSWFARNQVLKLNSKLHKRLKHQVPAYKRALTWFNTHNIVSSGFIRFDRVAQRYQQFLNNTIESSFRRRLVYFITGVFIVVSILFLATGLLKNEFFPASDIENLYVNIEGPAGWTSRQTNTVLEQVEGMIAATPEIISIISQTGASFDPNSGGSGSGSNTGYISITLTPTENRERTSIEIAEEIRDLTESIQSADITVVELSGGPPAGAAFQVNIKGDDLAVLEQISNDFAAMVEQIEGTINVDTTLKQSAGEIQVNLIDQALAERNLSAVQVGSFIRTALSGNDVSTISLAEEDQDITITLSDKNTPIEQVQNLIIPGPSGSYSLSEIATLTLETSPQSVVREDEQRVVRVLAGTSENASSTEVLADFQSLAEAYDMPEGYTWDVGGVNEENQRSINSILQAMSVSVILILITMVLQLESFRKAAIVLSVIPLAVAGVFFNFTIFQIPLSFPALIGVLALFGIVVNNSIMLVEKINQNLNFGFNLKDAITDACSTRIEPILLTSLTTSAGLLPITISDPLWRGLGGAIIAGLSVSGILILVLLPTLYYEIFRNDPNVKTK